MRGFLASTKEEATNSQKTTAKRWFIKEFDWLMKTLNEYELTAESKELDKFMEETSKVDDMIAETNKKYVGLRDNRFLFLTLADCAIANQQPQNASKYFDKLMLIDPIRENFYLWRK